MRTQERLSSLHSFVGAVATPWTNYTLAQAYIPKVEQAGFLYWEMTLNLAHDHKFVNKIKLHDFLS